MIGSILTNIATWWLTDGEFIARAAAAGVLTFAAAKAGFFISDHVHTKGR